jgi:hypothetical protein
MHPLLLLPLAQVLGAASAKFLHRRRSTYQEAMAPTCRLFLSAVQPMALLSPLPALDASRTMTPVHRAYLNRVLGLLPPDFLQQ